MTENVLDPIVAALAEQVAALLRPVFAGRGEIRKRLLSVGEAAEYLGRSPKAIHAMVERGKIPVVRVDSRRFFDISDLDRPSWEALSRGIPFPALAWPKSR